jgi:hypothetical protein
MPLAARATEAAAPFERRDPLPGEGDRRRPARVGCGRISVATTSSAVPCASMRERKGLMRAGIPVMRASRSAASKR